MKFELIQTFMHALVTCKNEDDSIKNEGARVVTTLFMSMFFSRRSRAANSAVHDRILAKFRTHPYTYGFPNYLQESRRSGQK